MYRHLIRYLFNFPLKIITTIIFPFYIIKNLFFMNKSFHILTYHRVIDLPKEKMIPYYNVTPKMFEKQMGYLKENHYNVITLEELLDIKNKSGEIPSKSIVITFDDGFRDNYLYALPVLKRFRFNANFFVVSDYLDRQEVFPWLRLDPQARMHYEQNASLWYALSLSELIEMQDAGQNIGSHSRSHTRLSSMNKIHIRDELYSSKADIEKILGRKIFCLAYPYGSWREASQIIRKIAKETGYSVAVTGELGRNTIDSDFFALRRIPIYQGDSLFEFKKKVNGVYDWLSYLQKLWMKVLPADKVGKVEDFKREWKVKDFDQNDLTCISNFRKELQKETTSFRRSIETSYYEWKLLKNPIGKSIFCLVEDNGQIIAQLGVVPKLIKIFDARIVSAELGDAITDKNYRGQGLFTFLLKETRERALKEGITLIYGQSNERSLPGERKAGYDTIPNFGLKNYIKIVNFQKVLKLKVGNKIVSSCISFICTKLLKYSLNINKDKDYKSKYDITYITEFDESVESFFEQVSNDYDVILIRNRNYLKWRFLDNPDNYDIFMARKDGKVLGFVVIKIGFFDKLRVGYIADFLTVKDGRIFADLIRFALKEFHKKDVDIISCWALRNSFYARELMKRYFLPYKNIPFIIYRSKLGNSLIKSNHVWHFTMADSDNI